MNFSLTLSYDGTRYYGWQKTIHFPTIQGEIEAACQKILKERIDVEAASRTDRGVHAAQQRVQFSTPKTMEPRRLLRALNAVLPPDIRVIAAEEASPDFHVALDATAKTYHYRIDCGPAQDPFSRKYSWHYPFFLDIEKMDLAAQKLCGEHDFSSFTTEQKENCIRRIDRIECLTSPDESLLIAITGNRFLYKMARTIAGTLANIGSGKLEPGCIDTLLSAKDRSLAGVTAPAHGLTLFQVHYGHSVNSLTRKF